VTPPYDPYTDPNARFTEDSQTRLTEDGQIRFINP
jgi:hypothetical protein